MNDYVLILNLLIYRISVHLTVLVTLQLFHYSLQAAYGYAITGKNANASNQTVMILFTITHTIK